jgi:hypothetical protein
MSNTFFLESMGEPTTWTLDQVQRSGIRRKRWSCLRDGELTGIACPAIPSCCPRRELKAGGHTWLVLAPNEAFRGKVAINQWVATRANVWPRGRDLSGFHPTEAVNRRKSGPRLGQDEHFFQNPRKIPVPVTIRVTALSQTGGRTLGEPFAGVYDGKRFVAARRLYNTTPDTGGQGQAAAKQPERRTVPGRGASRIREDPGTVWRTPGSCAGQEGYCPRQEPHHEDR